MIKSIANAALAKVAAGLGISLTIAGSACALDSAAQTSPAAAPSLETALPKIDAHFRQEADADRFSGAVLIMQNGRILFERGYGLANREVQESITPATRFNLGSVDKFITRIAIFQLLEAGKLNLSDKIGEILPDYVNRSVREKVSIQHLLDMTSGIPSYWNARFRDRRQQLRTTDDFLALFAEEPLRFEPGQYYEYSNGGFILLGKVIERISGMTYADYVKAHISGPIGMNSTSLAPVPLQSRGYAIGYSRPTWDDGEQRSDVPPLMPNTDVLPGWGSSAGGGYSTVRDFALLDRALRQGRLLGPQVRRLFFGEEFLSGRGAGTGWNGGTPGANTVFLMLPEGTTMIIFANRDPDAATEARDKIFEIWGRPLPPPRPRAAPPRPRPE